MHCAHCGAQLMPNQRFCSKCGQPIAGVMPPPPVAVPVPPPQPSPPPQPAPAIQTGMPSTGVGYARPSRVARHITALALLWIIFSGFRLIPGLALLILGQSRLPFLMAPMNFPMRMFLGPFLGGLGLIFSGFAIAGMIAGGGLLARSPWARMLTIVLGCISLIRFPFGTALGIYTLWVLAPQFADAEYKDLARAN